MRAERFTAFMWLKRYAEVTTKIVLWQGVSMTPADLRSARLRLGYTQVELGRELGMSGNWIAQMEQGKAPIQRVTELAIKWLIWTHPAPVLDSPAIIEK